MGKGKLGEFLAFLKRALNNIRTFSGTVNDSMEKKDKEIVRYLELMHQRTISNKPKIRILLL